MSSRIVLVRHGETEANRNYRFAESDDVPLTDLGRQQALELALRIREQFQPQRLYTSCFARARETGAIIGYELGLEPSILDGVHERDFGCLRGKSYKEALETMHGERWLWTPEGGENLEQVQARVIAALRTIREPEAIVVSHGAVMESISAWVTGNWETAAIPSNCDIAVVEL